MSSLYNRLRTAVDSASDDSGLISSQNLLDSINSVSSSPLLESDLSALLQALNVHAVSPQQFVSDSFLSNIQPLLDQSQDSGSIFDQIVAYRDVFNKIDSDQDGKLFPDQLHELVRGLNRMENTGISRSPEPGSTEMLVAHLDRGAKGYVDFNDFVVGALRSSMAPTPSNPTSEFKESTSLSSFNDQARNGDDDDDDMFKTAFESENPSDLVFAAQPTELSISSPGMTHGSLDAHAQQILAKEAQQLKDMKTRIHQLEQKLSDVSSELNKSEASRVDLITKITDQEKQIEGYKKQAKAATDLESEKNQLSEAIEQLKANLQESREAIKSQQKKESELVAERDQLRNELHQKRMEINDVEDQLKQFRNEALESQGDKNLLAKLQAQLLEQAEKLETMLQQKIAAEQAHTTLVQTLQELQTKHEETLLEIDDTKKKLAELEGDQIALAASPMRPKGSNLKSELSSSLRNKSAIKMTPLSEVFAEDGSNAMSSSTVTSTNVTSTGNEAMLASLQEDINQLKAELDMLEKEKKELLSHLSTAGVRTIQLEREKAELTGKVTSLTSDLTKSERQNGSIQRKLDEANAELEEIRGQLNAAQDAVNMANAAAAKAAANAFVRPEATITEADLEELRVLRLARREMDEQLQKLRLQAEGDLVQLKALRSEVQQLRDMNRGLKARLTQAEELETPDDEMRRGLIANTRVNRHRGNDCCAPSCNIM